MGQCVSSESEHKDPDFGHDYLQPSCPHLHDFPGSPPMKEKPQNQMVDEFTKFDQNSRTTSSFSYGSEKEAFYDPQPWLDSDCDDDFHSVNGDFTPSRGNTPFRVSFASPDVRRSPYWDGGALTSSTPGTDQAPRKKSLSDLFEDSGRYATEEGILCLNAVINCNEGDCVYTSAANSPYIVAARSSYTGEKTPVGNVTVRKVSSLKSVKCCLPQLLLSHSFSDSRKKGEHTVGTQRSGVAGQCSSSSDCKKKSLCYQK